MLYCKMKRTEATRLIDEVRKMLAERKSAEDIEQMLEDQFVTAPLQKCNGEAHSNGFIDNCGRCSPRWGLVGHQIKVT